MNTYNTVDNSIVDSWLPRARRGATSTAARRGPRDVTRRLVRPGGREA